MPGILATQYAHYNGPNNGYGYSNFFITGRNESSYDREVRLYILRYTEGVSTYSMDVIGPANGSWLPWTSTGQLNYSCNALHGGSITVHYTPADGILSGTFAFDGYDSSTRETVHVTDGRFDIAR